MRQKLERFEMVSLFLAVFSALGLVIYWHAVNRAYPEGDFAEYLWISAHIRQAFLAGGFWAGLKAVYTFRIWKPIIHPIFAVPALLLTSGNLLFGQALTLALMYGLLAAAIYRLSRLYLKKLDSVLVVAAILSIRWMTILSHTLNSELPFVLFFFATWALILSSDGFKKKRQSLLAGATLGMAACVRPAEAMLLFSLPLIAYIAYSIRVKALDWRDLLSGALESAIIVGPVVYVLTPLDRLPWWQDGNYKGLAIVLSGVAAAICAYSLFLKKYARTGFQIFVLCTAAISLAWSGAFLGRLFEWVSIASYHKGGMNIDHLVGFLPMFQNLKEGLVGSMGAVVVLLAVVFGGRWALKRPKGKLPSPAALLLVLAVMTGVHYYLGAVSYNRDIRYYLIDFASIYVVVLILFLGHERMITIKRVVISLIAVISILSRLMEYDAIDRKEWVLKAANWGEGYRGTEPPWRLADNGTVFFEKYSPLIKVAGVPKVLLYRTIDSWPITWFLEPLSMNLVSLSKGHEVSAFLPEHELPHDYQEVVMAEGSTFDYFLVGPMELADARLISELKSQKHGETHQFSITYDPNSAPATFYWISAK